MKPFRFSLQPIRALRQHKEQVVRERYAGTLRARETAAAHLQNANDELAGCWTALCDKLAAGVDSLELLRARAWCNVLELRVKERATALETARQAVDSVWQELMLASREREALDRFHGKRRRAYDRAAQHDEQKRLDELALQLVQSPVASRLSAHTNTP